MDLFFPSLFDQPNDISFIEQEPDEHIELFLRQHPVVNLQWIILSIIAFLFPIAAVLVDSITGMNLLAQLPAHVQLALLIVWYMLVLSYIFQNFLYWYFNIYIVTNHHLVDVDFFSLMYRRIVEVELDDIEDVSSTIKGVFGPMFNYGDVEVETAGKEQHILFEKISRPDFVSDRIEDLRGGVEKKGGE